MRPIIDPRRGDIEDDSASPKHHSMLALLGSLLAEISLPKLALAWLSLIVVPAAMLGVAPIVASIWLGKLSDKLATALAGAWSATLLVGLVAVGWYAGPRIFQLAERNFWSLNSLAVQPFYTMCREVFRHVVARRGTTDGAVGPAGLHSATAVLSGLVVCAVAIAALLLAWPSAHVLSDIAILSSPRRLAGVALANSVVIVSAYVAVAALVWAAADAALGQPRDLPAFDAAIAGDRVWRIAHLSDIHLVGERYGLRIESGRSGPRGNARFEAVLRKLDALDADEPLDAILITGDMTDAGRSAEWVEFFDAVARHPGLADRMLILPGNHDLNIVDRANPARLDLPISPNKRLRTFRTLSALVALQGERIQVVDRANGMLGKSLAAVVVPFAAAIMTFADTARPLITRDLSDLWARIFPMVLPPEREDGIGIILLNSNADTHFSFTNALGMISNEQVRGIDIACRQFPRACWVIALHHHVVEYPRPAKSLSERIGTALVNGNWFVQRLWSLRGRVVLMHGHRHIDWIGECSGLRIVSAPSPVMDATDATATHFYIQRLAVGRHGGLRLLEPQRVTIAGQTDG